MSGIAGVAVRNDAGSSQPLPEILWGLLAAMAHRGGVALPSSGRPSVVLREAIGHGQGQGWADAYCALGAQLLPRTPEDSFDQQPLCDPASGCVLVWDGRLDNRDELAAALMTPAQSQPDSALVLRAFLRWREGCAAKLLGDFAFAVWDPKERALYAARDPMGVRPLFYHESADRLVFASEVQALLKAPGVSRTPDDFMIGEALLWWSTFPQVERTFYRDVHRLPPAHQLRWTPRGLRVGRYWDIDPNREIRYRRSEQYVEQYAELLRNAVACRLRTNRAAAVFLSGGMDSSAVASVTGQLAPPMSARAFHLQLADENDESPTAELVARRAGIPFSSLRLREENVLDELGPYIRLGGIPVADLMFPNDLRLTHLAAQEGCGALFTGDGSDEVFAFGWAYVADMIRSFRWWRLATTIGPYAAYHGQSPRYFLGKSLRYLMPRSLMRVWKRVKWQHAPAWIEPGFARRTEIAQRIRSLPVKTGFSSFSTQEDYVTLARGRRILIDERRELEAARLGLEYRFPFYDRRMLEFMFAVPWQEKVDEWRVKPFLRKVPGLLPEVLQQAGRKANYNSYGHRLSQAQDWPSLRPLFEAGAPKAAEFVDVVGARRIAVRFLEHKDVSQKNVFLRLAVFILWVEAAGLE